METGVQHDPEGQRFFLKLGSEEAYLSYTRKDTVLDFLYVYTPVAYRGQGAAGRILITAFEYARENGCQVIPTCPFIKHEFLPRFSKYQDLVQLNQIDSQT
ncbi:MAG: GNAT family N-acetyltransferase [Candidatus Neomarinimicrobiota bacterium]